MVLQWDYIVVQRVAVSAASVKSAGPSRTTREICVAVVLPWCCSGVAAGCVVLQRVAVCAAS